MPTLLEGKKEHSCNNMATFSLGTSGVTPGAPGVYINERAGNIATAQLADFSTVYMLVETDRKSTRLNSSHVSESRMPSSA